jgi:hypothetical protein
MDTYNVYFASAVAATVVMRSCCGAAFPLFSPSMFNALGDQWAMSVFAILSTICMPIPVLFWVRFSPSNKARLDFQQYHSFTEIRMVDPK